MKDFLYRLFQGRYGAYGTDRLTKFCLVIAVVLLFVSFLTPLGFLYYVAIAILAYSYFRLFSKNIPFRYRENEIFVKYTNKIADFFRSFGDSWTQKKNYHIYKCPNCGQKIRVPRGKGRIEIRCPKCDNRFLKKS
ncbi:hypothetical protein [Butyrivibrio sp. WCE2006]|uniref:hypothetical protein n=1 Tax=Butyrivibrio sp. WCE2006 TaxID=1410611 RepID=UPI0005D29691|nr:hypothetical protein [Butyrivibrio sp. WCE2006]